MENNSKEKQLRYSEAFYSVQGEGKFVGVPSVFLRTFGCNFRCMNFGTDEKRDRWEQHKAGKKHNAEVKALIDAGVHKTTKEFNVGGLPAAGGNWKEWARSVKENPMPISYDVSSLSISLLYVKDKLG